MTFYKQLDERMQCTLCQHYCKLKVSQVGICGVNKNVGDKVECLVYGYPCALNVDPIEKKPLYHFLPGSKILSLGTVGCNFHCNFCQNWGISQEKKIDKRVFYSVEKIVALAKQEQTPSIAFTYNEPTIFYPYARDIALEAKKYGIKSVYVSNGYESQEVIEDMDGIIDAINIDLKSFNPKYYQKSLGGNLEKVLENIKHFADKNIWIELTTLLVPSKNDSEEEITKMASFIVENLGVNVPWHLSAFHPNYKETSLPRTPLDSLQRAYRIAKEHGMNYVYLGNVNTESSTFCPNCGDILIQRSTFTETNSFIKGTSCPQCSAKIEGVFDA